MGLIKIYTIDSGSHGVVLEKHSVFIYVKDWIECANSPFNLRVFDISFSDESRLNALV